MFSFVRFTLPNSKMTLYGTAGVSNVDLWPLPAHGQRPCLFLLLVNLLSSSYSLQIINMATARPNAATRTSKRPKLNTGGDESNLSDLVNFQLPPRRQNFAGPRRSKKTASNSPWAKERQSLATTS